jgi:hypothetical protein
MASDALGELIAGLREGGPDLADPPDKLRPD